MKTTLHFAAAAAVISIACAPPGRLDFDERSIPSRDAGGPQDAPDLGASDLIDGRPSGTTPPETQLAPPDATTDDARDEDTASAEAMPAPAVDVIPPAPAPEPPVADAAPAETLSGGPDSPTMVTLPPPITVTSAPSPTPAPIDVPIPPQAPVDAAIPPAPVPPADASLANADAGAADGAAAVIGPRDALDASLAAADAGQVCGLGTCAQALVVDDFSDAELSTSTMGGTVTSDNQKVALVAGEVRFSWTGRNQFQDFMESFRSSWCGYDLRGYRVLRFRMRASAPDKAVKVFLGLGTSGCTTAANRLLDTLVVGTSSTTYELDLEAIGRDKAQFVEWSPLALDTTEYFLDDIQLLP